MYFYKVLEQFIGRGVELFENRTTGRLEIRPADVELKQGASGKYICDVGEDYVVIEFTMREGSHFDAYPFAQVTMRNWGDELTVAKSKKSLIEEKERDHSNKPSASV